MNVRISPARGSARPTSAVQSTQQTFSWPAPTRGLVANGNIAVTQPGAAYILDNFRCTATGVVLRRGRQRYSTLPGPVRSIFSYQAGNLNRLFATTDETIFDITNVPSPLNWSLGTDDWTLGEGEGVDEYTLGLDALDGLDAYTNTNGKWVVIQTQASSGDNWLIGANGSDPVFLYDGTDFSDATLTFGEGETVTSDDLSFVWSYKNRVFFIEKESLNAWYLPVGQIQGELARFSLGGQFRLGGELIMGATWSRDTGSGMAAVCAFFSSEGEVAIYQGSNPGEATDWGIVGVYRIGRPLGPKSIMEAGGDLFIATDIGLIPLSRALAADFAILGTEAVSESIIDLWSNEVAARIGNDWNVSFWSAKQQVIVALPTTADNPVRWLVANAKTKGWSTYSGWDASCVHVFRDRCFFGSSDGGVFLADSSGNDDGAAYTGTCLPAFDQMGVVGYKTASMLRDVWRGPYPFISKITNRVDYDETVPPAPSAVNITLASIWGDAVWGESEWGSSGLMREIKQQWKVSYGGGEVHSPLVQVTSASNAPLDAELIRIDAIFTTGHVVL